MWDLSSKTRDQTCIARQILNHWTTKEALQGLVFKRIFFSFYTPFKKQVQKQTASHPRPGLLHSTWWGLKPESYPLPVFCSIAQSCPTLCNPVDCSTSGLPVHHHVHRVGDAIQPSHPLSSPSPPAFSLSQHQGFFKWVSSSHQVVPMLSWHFPFP